MLSRVMSDGLPILLAAQMRAEFELAHPNTHPNRVAAYPIGVASPVYAWPPWRTDDPPNVPRTYLCRCVNGDGDVYQACHYWFKGWASAGPFVRVTGWVGLPPLTDPAASAYIRPAL